MYRILGKGEGELTAFMDEENEALSAQSSPSFAPLPKKGLGPHADETPQSITALWDIGRVTSPYPRTLVSAISGKAM